MIHLIEMLFPPQNDGYWDYVKKNLALLVPEVNEANPEDLSYVYGGYAPISCRQVFLISITITMISFVDLSNIVDSLNML